MPGVWVLNGRGGVGICDLECWPPMLPDGETGAKPGSCLGLMESIMWGECIDVFTPG